MKILFTIAFFLTLSTALTTANEGPCYLSLFKVGNTPLSTEEIVKNYRELLNVLGEGQLTPEVLEKMQASGDPFSIPEGVVLKSNTLKESLADFKALLSEHYKGEIPIVKELLGSLYTSAKNRSKTEQRQKERDQNVQRWTKQTIHNDVDNSGPFLNDTEFFTHKDKKLARYDIKKKKYVWEVSLTDGGPGQKLSWASELLLTPKKDLLVIVNPNSIGTLKLQTGDYKSGSLKTKHNRGFRFSKLSKDGEHLFLGGEDGESIVYKLPDLQPVFGKTQGSYPHGNGIIESPDGRYVFFVRSDNDQILYDLKEKKEVSLPDLDEAKFYHCHDAIFSKDSKTLTVANHNSKMMDFNITTGHFKPSKYKSNGKHLYTSADNEYVIIGRDTAYAEGKDVRPFTVLREKDGKDVTPDLSQLKFNRVTQLWAFPEHSKVVFQDSKDGQNYLYMLDLNSLEVDGHKLPQKPYIMGISGFTPDGKSLLTTGNGGPLIEVY